MPLSTQITEFLTNPDINPTFLKDTPVILEKDYTEIDPYCSKY